MMNFFKNIVFILFFSISCGLSGQEKESFGYRIEGEDVIFTFDIRDYQKFTDESSHKKIEFDDFEIDKVVVAGDFNNWSRDSWKMTRLSEHVFELRKKLIDFADNFEWQFKFVINNKIWAEPSSKMPNITDAQDILGKYKSTYNLKFYTSRIVEKGNAKFYLEGFEHAKKVILSGSFNRWNEGLYEMKKLKNGWGIQLQLPAGVYEYKFIVDGNWMEDPSHSDRVLNEYLGYNSVIRIAKDVEFVLYGYPNAEQVVLAGDFNNWSEDDYSMTKTSKGWTFTTSLVGGKYHYKFIVDGVWITDPNNKIREYDGKGNINSVCMVR